MSSLTRRQLIGLLGLVAVALVIMVLRLLIYRSPIELQLEISWPSDGAFRFRTTAVVVGATVGAALGISGVLLQALLRNPLAEPFILGISSGAGLGVMAAMFAVHQLQLIGWIANAYTAPAIVGGLATLAVVYALGQRRGLLDPVSLVLVGVIVSSICGAGIMFFQHAVGTGLRSEFTLWLMGHIPQAVSPWTMGFTAGLTILAAIWASGMGRAMDVATFGDDEARSVGLPLGRVRMMMFALAGILAAATVAIAGPIGFVGLVCPHAARLVMGPRHGPLVIGAAVAGIIMVVGADVARQGINIGTGRMPIGIFTALIGGPAFIGLLLTGRGRS